MDYNKNSIDISLLARILLKHQCIYVLFMLQRVSLCIHHVYTHTHAYSHTSRIPSTVSGTRRGPLLPPVYFAVCWPPVKFSQRCQPHGADWPTCDWHNLILETTLPSLPACNNPRQAGEGPPGAEYFGNRWHSWYPPRVSGRRMCLMPLSRLLVLNAGITCTRSWSRALIFGPYASVALIQVL